MKRGPTGRYESTATTGEAVRAFVPAPLPPEPPVDWGGDRQRLLERALLACGRLDGVTALLPDPDLFLYAYVRREAVLSSQIEGTQSSLSDLLLFELEEAPGVPFDDVVEVSNYVAALEHGLARLRGDFDPVGACSLPAVIDPLEPFPSHVSAITSPGPWHECLCIALSTGDRNRLRWKSRGHPTGQCVLPRSAVHPRVLPRVSQGRRIP